MKTKFTLAFLFIINFCGAQNYTLDWAKNFGNISRTAGTEVVIDHENNTYVTGTFNDEINIDGITLTSVGDADFFIAKFDPSGQVLWAKRGGGHFFAFYYFNSAHDWVNSMAVDDFGNLYVTGTFSGQATFNNTNLTTYSAEYYDAFLAKYDTEGNLQWINQIGGKNDDIGLEVKLDDENNVYYIGSSQSPTTNFSQDTVLLNTGFSACFAKYSPSGELIWAEKAINFPTLQHCGFEIDSDQNIYLSGTIGSGAYFQNIVVSGGSFSKFAFIAKYDNNGNILWVNKMEGSNDTFLGSNSRSISLDESNNIYSSGSFYDTLFINGSEFISKGEADIFVTKLNSDGEFIWITTAGDDQLDESYDITLNSHEVIIAGRFEDSLQFNNQTIESNGNFDIFVSRFDIENGNHINSQSFGGASTTDYYDHASGIHFFQNSLALTGSYSGTLDLVTDSLSSTGVFDAYILKWNWDCGGVFDGPPVTECESYLSPGGNLITASGSYQDTLINEYDCDSISQYDVTIVTIDATVIQNDATVTANATNANYQWIDCSTNQIIPNETNQNFTASVTGTYAVEVTQNGCTSVSECVDVIISSLDNYELAKGFVKIYPNPSPSLFNLEFTSFQENINTSLINTNGKILKEWNIKNQNSTQINLENYTNGVYWLKLKSEENTYVLKITKIE